MNDVERKTDCGEHDASPQNICEKLAADGDVLGLLDHLEDEAKPVVLQSSMSLISRCIRNKARADLSGLCDASFARIIGMATLLVARVQLFITHRLFGPPQLSLEVVIGRTVKAVG